MSQQIQNDPIYTLPFLYMNGLLISNDATTPHTILDIAAGQCRDSNDVIDITLGSANIAGETVAAPLLLNAAVNGANGLDTGTFAQATMYAIFMIADSRSYQPTACIATLGSNTSPLMPFGYDSYRLIGYWPTQASNAYWAVGYMSSAIGGNRAFTYDAPISVGTTSSQASYTAVNLTGFVPLVNNIPVTLAVSFSGTANDTLNIQPGNGTSGGTSAIITAQVTSQAYTTNVNVLAQNTTISSTLSPTINYKNSGTDTITMKVVSYQMSL